MKTQITRWTPWGDMESMRQRLGSIWGRDPFSGLAEREEGLAAADWMPRVDIAEDAREYLFKAELPEMRREDVKVTVEDGVLTITGERKMEKEEKKRRYHRIESEYGSFTRSFTLPASTSGEHVSAEFKDGVLKVHVPKDAKVAAKARAVKVS